MDIAQDVYNSAVQHLPLLIGVTVAAWWSFPILFKRAMNNGGGEAFAKIMETENVKQSAETEKKIKLAFQEHEKIEVEKIEHTRKELERLKDIEHAGIRADMLKLDGRIVRLEDRVYNREKVE